MMDTTTMNIPVSRRRSGTSTSIGITERHTPIDTCPTCSTGTCMDPPPRDPRADLRAFQPSSLTDSNVKGMRSWMDSPSASAGGESVGNHEQSPGLRIPDEGVPIPVRGRAMRSLRGREGAEHGELALGGHAEDRQRRALRGGEVQVSAPRVVVDDVDAGSRGRGRQLLAVVIDIEHDRTTLRAADEEESTILVERDPARPRAAVRPSGDERSESDVDR